MLRIVRIALAGACLLACAGAAQAHTPTEFTATTELDAYVRATFGDQFRMTGPVAVLKPDETAQRNKYFERAAVATVPVTFAHMATLDDDLNIPVTAAGDLLTLPKGTLLYRLIFRRVAVDANPVEVWCGDYSFKWGMLRDLTGYGIACFGKSPDGKAVLYRYPDTVVYYTNGTSKIVYANQPRRFPFGLDDEPRVSFDYPAITEVDAPSNAPAMALSLQVYLPAKNDPTVAAMWILGEAAEAPVNGGYTLIVPSQNDNNHIRVGLGDRVIEADFVPASKSLTRTTVTAGSVDGETGGARGPLVDIGNYYPWFGARPQPVTIPDTPWRFGAMTARVDTVAISEKTLAKGDTLLSATVALQDRYRLQSAPPRKLGITSFDAGDYVYGYEETGYQADGAPYRHRSWCGLAFMKALLVSEHQGVCIPRTRQGKSGNGRLKAWEINAFTDNQIVQAYADMALEAAEDSTPAEERLEMRVWSIGKGTLEIRTGLVRPDTFLGVHSYLLDFDADGTARLNLWDRIVTFKRQPDNTVIASVMATTAGHGPRFGATVWNHDP